MSGAVLNESEIELSSVEKKLSQIDNFKLIEYKINDSYNGAVIKCQYKNEDYEIELSKNKFDGASFPDVYLSQLYYFTPTEIENFKKSTFVLSVIMAFKKDPRKDFQLQLKIGLPIENASVDHEHIWFELVEIVGDVFKCKLTQEPYEAKDIKVGDIREFTLEDITDWIISTDDKNITPSSAYILL